MDFTAEECPAWAIQNDPDFDQYVVCLRCDHFNEDCPHECGPEFSFADVAYALEERWRKLTDLDAEIARLREAYTELHITTCSFFEGGYPGWAVGGEDRYCCTKNQSQSTPLVTATEQRARCRECARAALKEVDR
jgi:hypothetical protein